MISLPAIRARTLGQPNRLWLAILPGSWLFLFLMAPLGVIVTYSFLRRGEYGGIELQLTLENYQRAFDPLYLKILWKSLQFALSTTVACLVLAFPYAYYAAKARPVAQQFLLFLISVPMTVNFVVKSYALKGFLGAQGPLNSLLVSWGLISDPYPFLNHPLAILFGMVTNYLPLMVLPLFVGFEKFDFQLLEAARDLGCSARQGFISIFIPLNIRAIGTGCFLVFVPALGEFVIPDLFGGGRNMFIGGLITEQFLKNRDWPFGSALTMILMIFLFLGVFLRKPPSVKVVKEGRRQ